MIKAVLFDLDGTLLNRDASVRNFIDKQYERFVHRLPAIPKEEYRERFIELDDRGYVWKDKVYQQLIDEFGIRDITWEELLDDYLYSFKESCVAFPNLLKMLGELKQRNFLIGVITNGKGRFQMDNIKALEMAPYMDTILISEWEGVKKPEPQIFQRALERLRVAPEDSVFVGDHPEKDVKAAKGVGMKTIWKKDQHWNRPDADFIIDNLGEIPHRIKQLHTF
ncbi:HAD family hydrolase [Halobacillus sp. BBL2006]|uniref:HAD family hydrolase n=1 Tax=Halobacillus sp. BBL2006 TaxID=1543706 RepID=UPI0005421D9D|nr:HAD-IIIA family hydrolase [Halobacillus sp. BBL2006]KHE71388.1 L-2-haloalkanoic acid dehalogenase [Halobacillus sp. BBL2006]